MEETDFSIVIPAKNEADRLPFLLDEIRKLFPTVEIVIVNDGSTDKTGEIARSFNVRLVDQPYTKGNGAAIKAGARVATGKYIVFMDADGQHNPADIADLLGAIESGYDMAVGARNSQSQASIGRLWANWFYNKLSSYMVGYEIRDLTSGFRAINAKKFRQFMFMLPNGFSYPTTITMSFFRVGYSVKYIPIVARKRTGSSHINHLRDGVRFLLIIFKVGTLFSPLKIFFPASVGVFFTGVLYYLYTYFVDGRFTNMSALLFIASALIFFIGLISEQIAVLTYKGCGEDEDE